MHLSPHCPGVTRLFLDYLAGPARQAQSLFILGDLFEAWIGDDDDTPYVQKIVDAFKNTSRHGVAIHVQHGNRDFLLGNSFAASSNTRLIADPYLLILPEGNFVLSHGDALCTEDAEYQCFRAQVRTPGWQSAFLAKPMAERRALANHLREYSEQSKANKESALMDLDVKATEAFIRQHNYATFIHGHTHQPKTHHHLIDDYSVERWVLADWHEDRGEILIWDGNDLKRQAVL